VIDAVFKALADGSRRRLLDRLFERDGQPLHSLEAELAMSRFGVMKHLKVLEEAGLVTTDRRGREKLHYLNAIPIQEIYDRWVSKYAHPWTAGLTELRRDLEKGQVMNDRPPWEVVGGRAMAVFEIYIKTTPERLWEAITDPDQRARYSFGVSTTSDWTPGSKYESAAPGAVVATGENLEVDPPRRLVQTYQALWSDDVEDAGVTRVTWDIEPVGSSCRLTVTHDQLPDGADSQIFGGWPMVLSGLKTLVETGEQLDTPASLQYTEWGRSDGDD
jgi:uncharacterized protein YndB with AHSA1/START domain/DNA-binding transcriptional ArsR family regulator